MIFSPFWCNDDHQGVLDCHVTVWWCTSMAKEYWVQVSNDIKPRQEPTTMGSWPRLNVSCAFFFLQFFLFVSNYQLFFFLLCLLQIISFFFLLCFFKIISFFLYFFLLLKTITKNKKTCQNKDFHLNYWKERKEKKNPPYFFRCCLLQQPKRTNLTTLESSLLERLSCKRKKILNWLTIGSRLDFRCSSEYILRSSLMGSWFSVEGARVLFPSIEAVKIIWFEDIHA